MRKITYAFLFMLVSWSQTQAAQPESELRILEQALETSSDVVALPRSVPETIFVRACNACPGFSLRVDNRTRFFLGRTQVSLEELRAAAKTTIGYGIFFKNKTNEVTRIIVPSDAVPKDVAGRKGV